MKNSVNTYSRQAVAIPHPRYSTRYAPYPTVRASEYMSWSSRSWKEHLVLTIITGGLYLPIMLLPKSWWKGEHRP